MQFCLQGMQWRGKYIKTTTSKQMDVLDERRAKQSGLVFFKAQHSSPHHSCWPPQDKAKKISPCIKKTPKNATTTKPTKTPISCHSPSLRCCPKPDSSYHVSISLLVFLFLSCLLSLLPKHVSKAIHEVSSVQSSLILVSRCFGEVLVHLYLFF